MTAPETPEPETLEIDESRDRLLIGFALDRLWCETMGLMEGDSKERPLRLMAEVLERAGVPYALIGGVAVQLHTVEPRSTLDIDVAVPRFDDVPRGALLEAGFEYTGRHAHSDNWRAPGDGPLATRVAVQFSAEDVGIAEAVAHARSIVLDEGVRLRVATAEDLIVLKLAAALLEQHPQLRSPQLAASVRAIRDQILDAGLDG
jgi:hypothetical protein